MNLQAPQHPALAVADLPHILGRTQEQIVEMALVFYAQAVEAALAGKRLGVLDPQTGQVERVLDLPTPAALDEGLRTWGQQPLSVAEQEAIVARLAEPVVAVPALVSAFRALRDHQENRLAHLSRPE